MEGTDYFAVYIVRDDVVYTAFTKEDAHLLTVIQYLRVLIETFEESIKTNLSQEISRRPEVHLILDLLVDFSIPLLPSKNFLMTFMQKEGIWARSANMLTNKGSEKLSQKIMDKAIDEARTNDEAFWHPHLEGIVSFEDECLFDHDEILTGIIDSKGVVQTSEVMGKVDVENKSSKVHNSKFTLRQLHKLESYSMHSCAKKSRKRFEKDSIVTFTPGINKFTVLKYICNPFKFTLPFEVVPKFNINEESKTLRVKVTVRSLQVAGQYLKVTDFFANVHFPKYLTGSSVSAVEERGEFLLDDRANIGKWTIGTLKSNKDYEINGLFFLPQSFSAEEEVDIVISINFKIQSYILSGACIESIKMRDNSNPVDIITGIKSTTHVKNLEMRVTATASE